MIKNIVSWFALMVLAGVLSACGQQNQGGDQGADKAPGATEQPAPDAPAGGDKPAGQ